jgi:hypothetical protein
MNSRHTDQYGQYLLPTRTETDDTTIKPSDLCGVVYVDAATSKTVIIPATLGAGFSCLIVQLGAGQLTITGSGVPVITNRQGHEKTAGQYAAASIFTSDGLNFILAGDTGV